MNTRKRFLDSCDWWTCFMLILLFAPFYLLFLYHMPFQINTDEITTMIVLKRDLGDPSVHIWGLSNFFQFPAFIYIVFGWLGELLGGIMLFNMRLIHAVFGLLLIGVGYFFFRLFFSRFIAAGAVLMLGANHALLAISRMAMKENTALLFELLSLTVLFYGFQKRKLLIALLGGAIAGLTFYTYYPSRITFVVWMFFLVASALFFSKRMRFLKRVKIAGMNIFGFLLITVPILVLTFSKPTDGMNYSSQQFLFLPQGQKLQQEWIGTQTLAEAIKKNIMNGLSVFNNKIHDYGYIYPNEKHGFVDPLTGILIWIGFIGMVLHLASKKYRREGDLLNITGFLTIYLLFAFVITKAPNYTRLLVILPFSTYLAIRGLTMLCNIIYESLKKIVPRGANYIAKTAFILTVGIIFIWNLAIFGDFVKKGLTEGNDVGSTGRYVEARKNQAGYAFYLAASHGYPYYSWGEAWQWKDWMGFFSGESQKAEVLDPQNFHINLREKSFTLFLSNKLWQEKALLMQTLYPNLKLHNIKTDGSLLAVEVF